MLAIIFHIFFGAAGYNKLNSPGGNKILWQLRVLYPAPSTQLPEITEMIYFHLCVYVYLMYFS